MSRPIGVTILSVWSVVVGLSIGILAVLAVYVWGVLPASLYNTFRDNPEVVVVVALVVTGVHMVMAYGLWTLRGWARWLAIAFAVIGIGAGMLTLPFGLAGILVSLASAWYLMDFRVKRAFHAANRLAPGEK